ncbi:MAG: hypothetical protein JWM31_1849, partial [Solirubrobacterales bacterium]|nr:hypothetical protein [Solirubrobacterales bacterium]
APAAPAAPAAETPPADRPQSPLRLVPDPEPERVVPLRPEEDGDDREPGSEPDPPLVAEQAPMDGERAVAVLTATLDDLGAAHRRPFSHG